MAGKILRKAGIILLIILKSILQGMLFLLGLALTAARLFILLFAMVLRIFLAFFGMSIVIG